MPRKQTKYTRLARCDPGYCVSTVFFGVHAKQSGAVSVSSEIDLASAASKRRDADGLDQAREM